MKKTTKLVAAALGVLLVAALFVGAGAAAAGTNATFEKTAYTIVVGDSTFTIKATSTDPAGSTFAYVIDGAASGTAVTSAADQSITIPNTAFSGLAAGSHTVEIYDDAAKTTKLAGPVTLNVLKATSLVITIPAPTPATKPFEIGDKFTVTVTVNNTTDAPVNYFINKMDFATLGNPSVSGAAKVTTDTVGTMITVSAGKDAVVTFQQATATMVTAGAKPINLLKDGAIVGTDNLDQINPKIAFANGTTADFDVLIGKPVELIAYGNPGTTYSVETDTSGFKYDTTSADTYKNFTIGQDGTAKITLTAVKARDPAAPIELLAKDKGAKVAETVAKVGIKVAILKFDPETAVLPASGTPAATNKPLVKGDTFKVTFTGGKATETYTLQYNEKVFSTSTETPGYVTVKDGQTVYFTVIGVPANVAVPTTGIFLTGSEGSVTINANIWVNPSLTVAKPKVIVGKENVDVTANADGFLLFDTNLFTYDGTAAHGTITAAATVPVHVSHTGYVAVTAGEKVTLKTGNGTSAKTELILTRTQPADDATTTIIAAGYTVPVTAEIAVIPELKIVKPVGDLTAGDELEVKITAVKDTYYIIPDSEVLYAKIQEGVTKIKDTDTAGFATTYNLFKTNENGEFTIWIESRESLEGYWADLKLHATPTGGAVTSYVGPELYTEELWFDGIEYTGDTQTVMAYHPYTAKDGFGPGKYYLVNEQGIQTATYINALPVSTGSNQFYFAPSTLDAEGLYVNNEGVEVRMYFPTIDVAAANVVFDDGRTTFTYGLWDGAIVKDDDNYDLELVALTPGVKIEDSHTYIKFEVVDANGAATIINANYAGDGKYTIDNSAFHGLKSGDYVILPFFEDKYHNFLVAGTPEELTWGYEIPFTLIKAGDEKIALSTDEVVVGEKFVATVTGLPGHRYEIVVPDEIKVTAQKDVTPATSYQPAYFTMTAPGVFDVTLEALGTVDDAAITLQEYWNDTYIDDATITVKDAVITAETDKDAYTIGDDIKVSGTSSGADVFFYLEGTNIPFKQLFDKSGKKITAATEEWDVTITYEDLKKTYGAGLDAGTYTLYVSTEDGKTVKEDVTDKACVTLPLTLKQSFITLTSVPEVVAQGGKITIEGTANAAKSVVWYLFGTNYFEAGVQKVKDDEFTITIDGKYTKSEDMAAGQYFVVVQHPMYDGLYSIAPEGMEKWNSGDSSLSKEVTLNNILKSDKEGIYTSVLPLKYTPDTRDWSTIFDTNIRQTNNAAQALCDALDSQNFDDMYAKASFIVGAPTSIVNPIPAKVTQGEKITISGKTTGHVGDIVAIDFISTAFAAVPKEVAGTAAFVTITTKVQDDGTWSVDFDTSNLNCDDYNVSVAVGSLGAVTSKITVTEKQVTPTVKPTVQPTQQPTVVPTTAAPTQTPSTPGFGILAALAGLGAVAVLLLRRQ